VQGEESVPDTQDEASRLTLAPGLPAGIRVGLVRAGPVAVAPAGEALTAEIVETCGRLTAQHAGKPPADITGLAPARELYRAFGIDPTHTRPSSEALLRRALQGKPMPKILNAVDVCTLCSLLFLLPIGLYDAGKIRGGATLRRGKPGESYPGIRKDEVHLEGRPVLVDEEGPFGNPTSDSLRTSVTTATTALWIVIFSPGSVPRATLEAHVAAAADLMSRHLAPAGAATTTVGGILP
jgi:DNA/RNA-binding domain of Phe-tRNA-synthetase-like protein